MHTLRTLCLLLLAVIATAASLSTLHAMDIDQVPNVHAASRHRYVSNPSGVLSPQAVERLDRTLARVWHDTGAEVVVVAIDSIPPNTTPQEYATDLFEKWGIGKSDSDNGLLLLLARDSRAVQLRTGYGMEGVVPDAVAGRIIRQLMQPRFRQGDWDGGVEAGVDALAGIITDPTAAQELKSRYPNDSRAASTTVDPLDDLDTDQLMSFLLAFGAAIAAAMLAAVLWVIASTRRLDDAQRYAALGRLWIAAAAAAFLSMGIGLIPFGLLVWAMHRTRRHKRDCPHCGTRMKLIDEVRDNDYLNPAQDLEEKLGSVDYDVWHCPACAQTDIIPYIKRGTRYTECPACGARAMSLTDRRIVRPPTTAGDGEGMDIFYCRNCGNRHQRHFRLPRKPQQDAAALAAGAVLGSTLGRGGSFGGGGGFSGGSFGGGHTGGGGAGGSW